MAGTVWDEREGRVFWFIERPMRACVSPGGVTVGATMSEKGERPEKVVGAEMTPGNAEEFARGIMVLAAEAAGGGSA